MAELVLDHPERVLHFGPGARFQGPQLINQAIRLPAIVQRPASSVQRLSGRIAMFQRTSGLVMSRRVIKLIYRGVV